MDINNYSKQGVKNTTKTPKQGRIHQYFLDFPRLPVENFLSNKLTMNYLKLCLEGNRKKS